MPDLTLPNILALTFMGAVVFGAVVWILLRKWLHSQLSSLKTDDSPHLPKFQFEDVNTTRIFYMLQGKGPVVLFLHGIGASSYTWRYQITSLAKEFTVIAVDLPGFGKSSKSIDFQYSLDNMSATLLQFMEQLKIDHFYIVGSSMGGTIGLNMCRMAPQKIRKIALVAPATQPQLVPKGVDRLAWTSSWAQTLLTEKTMATIMGRVNANPTMINDLTIKTNLQPYVDDRNSIGIFLKATKVIRDKRLPSLFENLQTESVILYGAKDKMVPMWAMKKLSKLLHAPVHTHPEAGHHPHEDEYQWVNEKLKDFLTSGF